MVNIRYLIFYAKVLILIISLTLLLTNSVFSQKQYKFETIDASSGLSNNEINCVFQSSDGFIWFGTQNGLDKYDAYNFTSFYSIPGDTNSIIGNHVEVIVEDANHDLLIGTESGLFKYCKISNTFSTIIINNQIMDINVDKNGFYWIATSGNGLFCFDDKLNFVSNYKNIVDNYNSLCSNYLLTIEEDADGNLWIGSQDKGISIFNLKTRKFIKHFDISSFTEDLSYKIVNNIFKDDDNIIWICSENGVSFFDPHEDILTNKTKLKTINIRSNVMDCIQDEDNLLFSTRNGLFIYNKTSFEITRIKANNNDSYSLNSSALNSIFKDSQGSLWISTRDKGVYVAFNRKKDFKLYKYPYLKASELKNSSVLGLLEDNKGRLWVGIDGANLNIIDRKTNQFIDLDKDIDNDLIKTVFSIYQDSENNIWIGSYKGGLGLYDEKNNKIISFKEESENINSLSNNYVRDILEDKSGNFWVLTGEGGLNLFNRKNKSVTRFRKEIGNPNSLCSDFCISFVEDSDRMLWICTYDGLSKFDFENNSFKNFSHIINDSTSLSHSQSYCFLEDTKGNKLVGTAFGLNLYDPVNENFRTFYTIDGLPDNTINGILEDETNNSYWISTDKGIVNITLDQLLGKTSKDSIRYFSYHDGLQGSDFNHGAYYKSKSGEFFFGGGTGFNAFYPHDIKTNNVPPKVIFTDFKLSNKSIKPSDNSPLQHHISKSKSITLSYDEKVITFEFTAINFIDAEKNKFAYKLEGFDNEWTNAGNKRSATYTNISPGKYKFIVIASNNDGVWNNTGASVKLIITPPFWRTWWAYSIYFLLFLFLLFLYRKYTIIDVIEKKHIEIEKLNHKKREEINQLKFRFFTNISHELKTPLTLILGPLERLMSSEIIETEKIKLHDLMHKNIKRLLFLINQLIDYRKVETGNLNLSLTRGDLVNFINATCEIFDYYAKENSLNFEFKSEFKSLEISFDKDKIEKSIYNLLSNAFKYTKKNGCIAVNLKESKSKDMVVIEISNTGKGIAKEQLPYIFDRFYQNSVNEVDTTLKQTGSGVGLALTKGLIELHSGKIEVNSEADKLTTFIIYLPTNLIASQSENTNEAVNKSLKLQTNLVLNSIDNETISKETVTDSKSKIILVVDDNNDIRGFIKTLLIANNYKVLEAENGRKALEVTKTNLPDLIISDVMMDIMDGIEYCKIVKADINLSHIPVVLLTARKSIEYQIKGLEIGADDYISKPFNDRVLLAKINNIFELRKKMTNRYSFDINLNSEEHSTKSVNDKFMKTVMQIVEDNLDNHEFDVDKFVKASGVSRTVLYNKLNKLTNSSPKEFINTIRLKQAAKLLQQTELKVSEIAYQIGFADPYYFSRSFKKHFGKSPKIYADEFRKDDEK